MTIPALLYLINGIIALTVVVRLYEIKETRTGDLQKVLLWVFASLMWYQLGWFAHVWLFGTGINVSSWFWVLFNAPFSFALIKMSMFLKTGIY